MISLIVASDMNHAIGYQNELLCRLEEDMKHFVKTTMDKPIIMGRKTFESLGCKPLKNRFNIVLTNNPMAMTVDHIDVLHDYSNIVFENFEMVQFMTEQSPDKEFIVIGGQQIYELFLPYASKIYLTRIHHQFKQADSFFPVLEQEEWKLTYREKFNRYMAPEGEHAFTISILERK